MFVFPKKNCLGRGVEESFIIASFDESLSKLRLTLSHVIIGLWSDNLFGKEGKPVSRRLQTPPF